MPPRRVTIGAAESRVASAARTTAAVAAAVFANTGYASIASLTRTSGTVATLRAPANALSRRPAADSPTSAAVGTAASTASRPVTAVAAA